jgi:hypothetical protein
MEIFYIKFGWYGFTAYGYVTLMGCRDVYKRLYLAPG